MDARDARRTKLPKVAKPKAFKKQKPPKARSAAKENTSRPANLLVLGADGDDTIDTREEVVTGRPTVLSVSSSPKAAPMRQIVHAATHLIPYDQALLERARTQWQFGDWQSLAQLSCNTLQHHPDRAKLALLAAAGRLQTGQDAEARQYIRLAQDWGVSKKLISQILIAGVHNSIGRAAAIGNQQHRALQHFENAITIGTPGADARLLTRGRTGEQLSQLGMITLGGFDKVGPGSTASGAPSQPLSSKISTPTADEKYAHFSSAQYWEERYQKGGTSGYGSYGRLAEFKANVVNKFIKDEGIERVIEFGCGDGNQSSMIHVKNYIGVDVSSTIVEKCRDMFRDDKSRIFLMNDEYLKDPLKGELALSLDVIFHLIEDGVFENYMAMLFDAAERYCIIYAPDEDCLESDAIHVRRRKFTKWIEDNLKGWRLMQVTYNKYPHDGSRNPKDASFSHFYFFERT